MQEERIEISEGTKVIIIRYTTDTPYEEIQNLSKALAAQATAFPAMPLVLAVPVDSGIQIEVH